MLDLPQGPALWIALAQIIGIDIILSGDNAVVIALAARRLPPRQRRMAVLLGTGAAILMRVLLAVLATALLVLPGLRLAGGALLLWIGITLLVPDSGGHGGAERPAAASLAGAIRIILLADAAMSLDNVIGVAAAAKGSVTLLALGLAISIPLMIGTSALLLRIMDRYPWIVTLGGALLGYVAGEMLAHDALTAPWLEAHVPHAGLVLASLGALVVVAVGKGLAARRARRAGAPVDLAREEHTP